MGGNRNGWPLAVVLAMALPAVAHGSAVMGEVWDAATGLPLEGVLVTATSPSMFGEQHAVTDATGHYHLAGLPPGTYTVRYEKESYQPYSRVFRLVFDRTIRMNTVLAPSGLEQCIDVSDGSAPPPPSSPYNVGAIVSPGITAPASPTRRLSPPNGQPFADMSFRDFGVNPTIDTEEERFSTFSVDVDSASYALARSYLQRGSLPDPASVRVEEFVNSLHYDDPAPPAGDFALAVEGFPSPNRNGYHVLRIGLKARDVPKLERAPSHLVFVVDVSGSMDIENRLGLVKQALTLLVDQLDERDLISLVAYGSFAHIVLDATPATQRQRILDAIDRLVPEGSTNAQAGLVLGYSLAARHLRKGGINRVVLCSDGVANNGVTDADSIWSQVKGFAAKGVTLSAVGFGMGNYNDVLMERLAQVGDGNYAYVDRLEEAERIFVQNLTGTLQVMAKDVKVQVEFDPSAVTRFRLLGYENRQLEREQFQDDAVDAGEVGAGHAVTALYEVKVRDSTRDLGTLRVRHKAPGGGASRLTELPIPAEALQESWDQAGGDSRLAFVAAAFAEKLRGSYWVRTLAWYRLRELYLSLPTGVRERADSAELGRLILSAQSLDHRADRFEAVLPLSTMDFDRTPAVK